MKQQSLIPGVQHAEEPDLRSEMARIGSHIYPHFSSRHLGVTASPQWRTLPSFLDECIEGDATIRIARNADGDAWRNLVLALDRLALGGCDVA